MAHALSSPDDLQQRSMVATREIATVVWEIRELLATACNDRVERSHNRRAPLEARKAAFVAECQDIAAMRPRWQHNAQLVDAHPANPAVAPEVQP